MNLINALKKNLWKTVVDKASTEGRPFGSNPMRAYISKPVESCVDLFNKTASQAFGNASKSYQEFYSWTQWMALEYVSATRDMGWTALQELSLEYGEPYRRELSQAQYGIVAYRDNEYIITDVKTIDEWVYSLSFDIRHGMGYVPAMVSTNTITSGLYRTARLLGVDVDTNRVSYQGSYLRRHRVRPAFHNVAGFQITQDYSNDLRLSTDDESIHAHLCMMSIIDSDTGKTVEHSRSGTQRNLTRYIPYQIDGGRKSSPHVSYRRKTSQSVTVLPPQSGFCIRHDLGDGNQNFLMHNADYIPQSAFDDIEPADFLTAYGLTSSDYGVRYINPEIERQRRYSLPITTEPYQTFKAVDDGTLAEISAVDIKGSHGTGMGYYICIRGNHSTINSIEQAMSNPGYNNDIIDTVAILDTDYLDDAVLSMTTIDRNGLRANAGIADNIVGLPIVFELTADFLGADLHEEIRYRYPGGRIFCMGAGSITHQNGDISYRLYCSGIQPDDVDNYSVSALVKNAGYTGIPPLAADHGGERLGPVVKLPGVNGYIRLLRRIRDVHPNRMGWQEAVMYEVELPFVFGGFAGMIWSPVFRSQVFAQLGYIKAGSWRRYVSIDSSTGEKIDPAINEMNWIGINERRPIVNTLEYTADVLGPTEFFETHNTGSQWNAMLFNNASLELEASTGYANATGRIKMDMGSVYSGVALTVKRLCCVDNSYWLSKGSKAVGYPGREYPAFRTALDVSDLGKHVDAAQAISVEGRWFVGRCVGGGDCDRDVVEPLAELPFLNDDLAIWLNSPKGYQRAVVNSRNTTIDSISAVNLVASYILPEYMPNYSSTSYQNNDTSSDSQLLRVKLLNSTGMPVLEQLYTAGFSAGNAFYNANLQCLYKKTADPSMTYCQTKSFKVIGSEFTGTFGTADFTLTLVVFIDDGQTMADAVEGLGLSKIDFGGGRVLGFCNILSPKSNHSGGAGAVIDTSRVFHVFSRVPNKYNGVLVEYIGVYKSGDDALAAVYGIATTYWMYYNALENEFYVYDGSQWQPFYGISDWSGIKSEFVDVMSDAFKTGVGSGGIYEMVFGHQPRRLPLPEHCLYFVQPPPVHTFISGIIDGCRPDSLALRYTGFLTKPAK